VTTTVVHSVGTAGRDYSTLAAWAAALPASLVAVDQIWKAELYNDSLFTTAATISTTTDATRYAWITAAAGQSFADNAGKLTNALFFNQANGVALQANSTASITLSAANVLVERLQIDGGSDRAISQGTAGTGVTVKQCLLTNSFTGTSNGCADMRGGAVVNSIAISRGGGVGFLSLSSNSQFRNCTAVTNGTAGTRGFRGNYDSPLYLNCAAFGFAIAFANTGNASNDYNASDLASTPGAHSLSSLTYANQFVSVTSDYRVKAGANLINAGTPDATNTGGVDIVGQTRSATTPTIGAWEYIASALYPTLSNIRFSPATSTGGYFAVDLS
jgi:hypothetical protein